MVQIALVKSYTEDIFSLEYNVPEDSLVSHDKGQSFSSDKSVFIFCFELREAVSMMFCWAQIGHVSWKYESLIPNVVLNIQYNANLWYWYIIEILDVNELNIGFPNSISHHIGWIYILYLLHYVPVIFYKQYSSYQNKIIGFETEGGDFVDISQVCVYFLLWT